MSTSGCPVLYRCYDAAGRLIYIGSTAKWGRRIGEHRKQSWWFPLLARLETKEHPSLESAQAAEAIALQEEQPAFNWRDTGRTWLARRDAWTDTDRALYDQWHDRPGASFDVAPPGRWSRTPRRAAPPVGSYYTA